MSPVAGDVLTCIDVQITDDGILKFGNRGMASKDVVYREINDAVAALTAAPKKPVKLFLYGLNMRILTETWATKYPVGYWQWRERTLNTTQRALQGLLNKVMDNGVMTPEDGLAVCRVVCPLFNLEPQDLYEKVNKHYKQNPLSADGMIPELWVLTLGAAVDKISKLETVNWGTD